MEDVIEDNNPHRPDPKPDYFLVLIGLFLLLTPIALVIIKPEAFHDSNGFLHIIASLGAGMVGAALPGFLHVELKSARAGGALAVFLIVFLVEPTSMTQEAPDSAVDLAARTATQTSPPNRTIIEPAPNPASTEAPITLDPNTTTPNDSNQVATPPARKVWREVMPESWVKVRSALYKSYYLAAGDGIFIWPLRIDSKSQSASFNVTTDSAGRNAGKVLLNQRTVNVGEGFSFNHDGENYRLTVTKIEKTGWLKTDAVFVKLDKQS